MKKLISVSAVIAAMGVLAVSAYADTSVHVTVSDANGTLVVIDEAVDVSDADGDGAVTINDALIAAHDKFYDGGAEAGYEAVNSDYGLSINKLWGTENGGSYGYYVNNASAWSLADPVNSGDHLNAFVYTDTTAWSDTYCYFDKNDYISSDGDVALTLSAASFDADWNPVTVPVAGADITVNGEKVGAVTDENGQVTLRFTGDGDYIISAVSDTQVLVPPVCKVYIQTTTNSLPTQSVDAAVTDTKGSPDTGIGDVAAVMGIAVAAIGGLIIAGKRK